MGNTKNSNIPLFIIMGLVTVLFLYLLKPFFFPIFWAAVIAGIFRPLYRRINGRLNEIISAMPPERILPIIVRWRMPPTAETGRLVAAFTAAAPSR